MEKNKIAGLFTIQRKTKAVEQKVNKTKQMLSLLGLLTLVIAIPLILLSLLDTAGDFETREKAEEELMLFGRIKIVNSDAGIYCISDNGNGCITPLGDKKMIFFSRNLLTDDLLTKINVGTKYFSFQNTELSGTDYNYNGIETHFITSATITEGTISQTGEIGLPTPSSITDIPEMIKVGEKFSFEFEINDKDSIDGDLLASSEVKATCSSGEDIKNTWGITYPTANYSNFPYKLTVEGTPTESTVEKIFHLEISGTDLVGTQYTIFYDIDIIENKKPVINVNYYENGKTILADKFQVNFAEKENILGKIEVTAADEDDSDLTYTFENIPSEFKDVLIDKGILNFSINWNNLSSHHNNFILKTTVSDGFNNITQEIPIKIIKAYANQDYQEGAIADFSHSVKSNTYEATFTVSNDSKLVGTEVDHYKWIFGNGTEAETKDKTITRSYSKEGTYDVSLIIYGKDGSAFGATKKITINSIGELKAPQASFTTVPQVGNAPLTVKINPASSYDEDGQIVKYNWDFGDGKKQELNSPVSFEHTYSQIGTYRIMLEVIDNDGLKSTQASNIIVGSNKSPIVTLTKPNQGIYGGGISNPNNKIAWIISDLENNSPLFYEIHLIKSQAGGTCNSETTQGAVSYKLSSGNTIYTSGQYLPSTFQWDTQTSRGGNVPDGYYCVRISIIDDTFGQYVTDFSNNAIEILNAKHSPYITTEAIPDGTVNVNYSTQISAYDEDGDSLKFSLAKTVSGFTISEKGLLTGKTTKGGPISIAIAVTDGTSTSTKVLNLNIKATEGQVLPAVTVNTSVEVFVGSNGVINWTMQNADNVKSLSLEYSTDGENWNEIVSNLSKDVNEYTWDVTNLEEGTYQIRLVYFDTKGNILGASDIKQLEIAKQESENESSPIIFGIKPEEDEELTDRTPVLSANFKASDGATVDLNSVVVYLDNKSIVEEEGFEAFEGGFAYIVPEDLSVGEHYIKVGFKDSAEKVVEKTWYFTIAEGTVVITEEAADGKMSSYMIAIITIIGISAFTTIVYFAIKKISEYRASKKIFSSKINKPVFSKANNTANVKTEDKIFRSVRATIEKGEDKLNLTEQEALQELKEKEVPKIKGEDNITKGY